ncbi:MAG: DMT family transporter [Pseudomonadota bacterium]
MQNLSVLSSLLLAMAGITSIAYGSVLAAESEVGPVATSFFRFALAAPVCIAFGLLFDRGVENFVRLFWQWQVWVAGAAFALTVGLWFQGQRISSVAGAGAVHNLAPVFVVGIGWLLFNALPRPSGLVGLLLAILGGVILVYEDFTALGGEALIGDELALASAVTLAVYFLCIEKVSTSASAFTVVGLVTAIAAPFALLAAVLLREPLLPANSSGWAILFGVALLGQIGGQAALARASVAIGAFGISTVSLAEPALAALLALAILSQPVSIGEWLGISVLAIGVALAQNGFKRLASDFHEPKAPHT